MKGKLLQEIKEIINKYDKSVQNIKDADFLSEVIIDELSKVQIIMEIERKFNIDFDIEDFQKFKTVSDLVGYIEEKRQNV